MDAVAVEAVNALEVAVGALMPAAVPASLTRHVRVLVTRIRHSGLGGYVGHHVDPSASLFARRIDARVEVSVTGGADAAATAYTAQLAGGMLTQSRADLAQHGILRLRGLPPAGIRDLAFDVAYEYVKLPTAGEGVIDAIDLEVFANTTPYRARFLWDFSAAALAAEGQPLAQFQVEDDPDLDGGSPSGQWSFQSAPDAIAQSAQARGGALDLGEPRKAGTQLLWRPKAAPLDLARFFARVDFESASSDGLGFVFGRRSATDFWFFLASQRHRYHVFGRRSGAGWRLVGAPAEAGFSLNTHHRLSIGVYDNALIAELDGDRTLTVAADEALQAGEIGLLTHGNDGARFQSGRLIELV